RSAPGTGGPPRGAPARTAPRARAAGSRGSRTAPAAAPRWRRWRRPRARTPRPCRGSRPARRCSSSAPRPASRAARGAGAAWGLAARSLVVSSGDGAGGPLLRDAVEGAAAGDQADGREADDLAAGEERAQHLERLLVLGVAVVRHDHDAVDQVGVAVAGRESLAVHNNAAQRQRQPYEVVRRAVGLA